MFQWEACSKKLKKEVALKILNKNLILTLINRHSVNQS